MSWEPTLAASEQPVTTSEQLVTASEPAVSRSEQPITTSEPAVTSELPDAMGDVRGTAVIDRADGRREQGTTSEVSDSSAQETALIRHDSGKRVHVSSEISDDPDTIALARTPTGLDHARDGTGAA